MKRSIKSLIGYTMHATDGEIGEVAEFYFDDHQWTVRYLIVRTGGWLFGRKVLISPQSLQTMDWKNRSFPIDLTKEQIRNSPDIDTDKPISRQEEEKLHAHYPWKGYWNGDFAANGVWGILPDQEVIKELIAAGNDERPPGDIHLRSTSRVTGYRIHATDGEIGEVTDYIVDDSNWKINFLVVKTGSWIKPEKLLLSTQWIIAISWADSSICVDISLDRVKRSRAYEDSLYVDSEYEHQIFDDYIASRESKNG